MTTEAHDHEHAPGSAPDHGGSGHGHSHGAGASQRRLIIALALTTTFLIAEVVAGLMFRSLALLSDAAHMMTDVIALAIALAAIQIGRKPSDDRRTYGYRRFEILAAAFNAVLLFGVAFYILYEAVKRFFEPEPVQSVGMLAVAVLGLAVNLISMRILSSGKESSLNVKGAYLEVWADMLGSVGVVGAAVVIMVTGWKWVDPVVAVGIGFWVLPRTWMLLKETTHILLEGAPKGVDLAEVRAAVAAVPGVASLHDFHVWISGADTPSATVHVVLTSGAAWDQVRRDVSAVLRDHFGVDHATVQIEAEPREEVGVHR